MISGILKIMQEILKPLFLPPDPFAVTFLYFIVRSDGDVIPAGGVISIGDDDEEDPPKKDDFILFKTFEICIKVEAGITGLFDTSPADRLLIRLYILIFLPFESM
jgi:hypothetical protein